MLAHLHFAVLLEAGTNPTEFNYINLRLKEAGAQVTVIGLDRLEYQLEDHSVGFADVTIDQATGHSFDGVIIPGGLGPEKLRLNPLVIQLVKDCHSRGKLCAAICHGQMVLISAGLMEGVKATAAWSMMDDLRMVGAVVPEGQRVVRDGQFVTAIFPQDLPEFFQSVFQTLVDIEGIQLPAGYSARLTGQTWGIVVDNFTDAVHLNYLRLRIIEEGGSPVLLGRQAGQPIKLSSPAWEWGELGLTGQVELALLNPAAIPSCDTEAELNSLAVSADDLDGLILPGGVATWMIRSHPGLKLLIQQMNAAGKPLVAVGRGPKLLFLTGALDGRTITCADVMRDDVIHAVENVTYQDAPVVLHQNLLTCQGTDDLPHLMRTLIEAYASQGE